MRSTSGVTGLPSTAFDRPKLKPRSSGLGPIRRSCVALAASVPGGRLAAMNAKTSPAGDPDAFCHEHESLLACGSTTWIVHHRATARPLIVPPRAWTRWRSGPDWRLSGASRRLGGRVGRRAQTGRRSSTGSNTGGHDAGHASSGRAAGIHKRWPPLRARQGRHGQCLRMGATPQPLANRTIGTPFYFGTHYIALNTLEGLDSPLQNSPLTGSCPRCI